MAEADLQRQQQESKGELRTEELLINMGPQHPSTHGVLRVVLRTDGELVLEATPYIGYLHRRCQPYAAIGAGRDNEPK